MDFPLILISQDPKVLNISVGRSLLKSLAYFMTNNISNKAFWRILVVQDWPKMSSLGYIAILAKVLTYMDPITHNKCSGFVFYN